MRTAYKVLGYLIAIEIVIQAAAMVFAVAGLGIWVEDGGVLDKAAFEDENLSFTGAAGFMIHGMNGMMIIPLLALALLIVSFFAKVPRGITTAAVVLGLVVLQVLLGLFGHESAYIGLLHGINAFALFSAAFYAGRLGSRQAAPEMTTPSERIRA